MTNVVRVKPGVEFTVIAPGGFLMLSAIQAATSPLEMNMDLTITSACDGVHSGPDDPHHRGEAYDIRTHDMTSQQKTDCVAIIMGLLGWDQFYGFLEDAGSDNEHIHVQVKKGTTYP